jgi:S-adenosylmethionine:tRNA ribosyltransferase-isomerase
MLKAKVISKFDEGITHVKLIYDGILMEILDKLGTMPLPPYIHEKLEDQSRYQTVYAKYTGSAAAPTAGLHFTNELLDKIKEKGVEVLYVTLNVGLGTFRPVSENDITKHDMHSEKYEISKDVCDKLNKCKKDKRRIICVGTTSLRTLEANISKYGKFTPTIEETDIFIYPPYEFKSTDALITNFHLPKSTLVMLVSAFSSVDIIKKAYNHAQNEKYRFFSFGDAMFLTNEEI